MSLFDKEAFSLLKSIPTLHNAKRSERYNWQVWMTTHS